MTTFQEVPVSCQCCNHPYKATVLTSTNTFGGRTTDFHTRAAGFDPLYFVVSSCTQCGYTDYSETIIKGEAVPDDIRAHINAELRPIAQAGKVSKPEQYAFMARIFEWKGKPALEIADSYLKAAWLAADGGGGDEKAYRQKAIAWYQKVLDTPDDRINPLVLMYLVGELSRRIGDTATATRWFDEVIQQAGNEPADSGIADLARQQRDNPKDTM